MTFQKKVLLDAATLSPVSNLGWDISHARRLVHAFDAIEQNIQYVKPFEGKPNFHCDIISVDREDYLYKDNLHKNDMIATATFQDIQASGKMILTSIHAIETKVKQLGS